MSADQFNSIQDVWGQIKDWPEDMRSSLAAKILISLKDESATPRRSLSDLVGILATVQPPPTDADISRILEEERARKYS
jgi:hypothetical protein